MAQENKDLILVHFDVHTVDCFKPVVVLFPQVRHFKDVVGFLFNFYLVRGWLEVFRFYVFCLEFIRLVVVVSWAQLGSRVDLFLARAAEAEARVFALAKSLRQHCFQIKTHNKHHSPGHAHQKQALSHAEVLYLNIPSFEIYWQVCSVELHKNRYCLQHSYLGEPPA